MLDFILNGQGHGDVASRLLSCNGDVGILRPFLGADGRSYVTMMVMNNHTGKMEPKTFVTNAPTSMRRDDWKILDDAVMRTARPRLRIIGDLRSAGLTMNLPNGMGKIIMEYETIGDITPATISMDGLRRSQGDRAEYGLGGIPLPIIHKDFDFTLRQILVSRNSNTPLDTTTAEAATRKVVEEADKLALGVAGSYGFGGYTIYGIINHPNRNTMDLTLPTDEEWTPKVLVQEVMQMKAKSVADLMYGPWAMYVSSAWDAYLDDDYADNNGTGTLRTRLRQIEGINDIRTADYLTGYQVVLVQQSSDVIRVIIGMDVTTLQWESHGGMQMNFKVMTIMVPQVRADPSGNSGIVHGVAA